MLKPLDGSSLFVSRMLTVVTTLRSQNRPVLDYLVEACRAARQGQLAPSLLPADSGTLWKITIILEIFKNIRLFTIFNLTESDFFWLTI